MSRDSSAPFQPHWWGLTIIFAYISIDEFVGIHEEMNAWFDLSGTLYFGWVIPASILVTIFVLAYLRFLLHLPASTRFAFVRAGAVFVGGAVGIELLLGYWTDPYGSRNLGYAIIDWVEETMEMCGAALFISALLAVLAEDTPVLRVVSASQTPSAGRSPSPDAVEASHPDNEPPVPLPETDHA